MREVREGETGMEVMRGETKKWNKGTRVWESYAEEQEGGETD